MERKSTWKEYLIYILIFVVVAVLMPKYVWGKTVVEGSSMEKTLKNNDWLITDKISYRFRNPKRFEIVVIDSPMEEGKNWVKRVIGLPGETIQIISGKVYINGEELKEDVYGNALVDYSGIAASPYQIPEDCYFLMGDNRQMDHSWDSRYEEISPIPKSEIWGRVIFRTRPLKRIGRVK